MVLHLVLPGLTWPAAFAIGAVVGPPDAVAATAVGRKIGLPRRLVTILEGESLLNDATALVALKTAILAAAGSATFLGVGVDFLRAAGGGAIIGFLAFLLVAWMRRRVTDPLLDTALSFLTPFAAYVAAELIHASGVISVVVAGLLLGHKAPIIQTAQSRITERITWRTVAYVLENTVFLLIGLQLDWILAAAAQSPVGAGRIALICGVTLVVVIVTRLVWVFPASLVLTRIGRRRAEPMPWTHTFLLGWAGMRGVVTLAAAFIIPADTPHRDVLLLIAFTVVAGTLFIQGFSLPWLTRRLDVRPPDPAADALARADHVAVLADEPDTTDNFSHSGFFFQLFLDEPVQQRQGIDIPLLLRQTVEAADGFGHLDLVRQRSFEGLQDGIGLYSRSLDVADGGARVAIGHMGNELLSVNDFLMGLGPEPASNAR